MSNPRNGIQEILVALYQPETVGGNSQAWPLLRQTFFSEGRAGRVRFFLTEKGCVFSDASWIVSFGGAPIPLEILRIFPKNRRIYVQMEHPAFFAPDVNYVANYGVAISPFEIKPSDGNIYLRSHAGLPWFYGIPFSANSGLTHEISVGEPLELQDLVSMKKPLKTKKLSCVVSQKTLTGGQVWRLQLAKRIKEFRPDLIDIYGFGSNPISDKRDAIDPYEYTLSIENFASDSYWTEKLSDAILGYACPIYAGAQHIKNYFSSGIVNLPYGGDVDELARFVIARVEEAPDQTALYENRLKVLFDYNIFYMLRDYISRWS